MWKGGGEGVVEPTNFHNLQLTLHLVVVAVLFEPLFEVVNFGGLKYFSSGGGLEPLKIFIHQAVNFTGTLLALLL